MDIAVTGLAPLLLPDPGRSRSRPDTARADNNQQNTARNRTQTQSDNPGGERLVRGEVLSSNSNHTRAVNSTLGALNERNMEFAQSDTRQISIYAAIQTYSDNEALIADPDQPRQVSGIIDEFV
ncbi:MAG: hypothetical protein OQL06_10900 [Gammaproteobacteria bacterium]|nr:hypothetical protein [Gammaproteobacteria bacterium]